MVAVCVGRVGELPPGRMAEVTAADGRPYLVCNVGGEFYAVDGRCPHRGAPLAYGALHEHTVVCPWHGWEFDCRTGRGVCGDVATARITIEEDRIYLHAGTA
ncbi:MAG TPA: Rieske (2Fe-2S) protein [Bryobacteraceae bacterium]|nr:Rieske (2Fe-2S) protein [Bryobacteraceae bacterium]